MTYGTKHFCYLNLDEESSSAGAVSFKKRIIQTFLDLTTVSKKNPNTKYYLKSDASIKRERLRHIASMNSVLIHPLSNFRWVWESFIFVIYFLYYILAPMRLCFVVQTPIMHPYPIDNLQLLMDIVFLVDIVINFNSGYCIENTKMIELEKKNIIKHYLSGFFMVDFISSMPFDYIVLMLLKTNVVLYIFVQLKTIFKYLRFTQFLSYSTTFFEGIWNKSRTMRFRGVLITFLIITHVAVCLHNLVGTVSMNLRINNPLLWHQRINLTKEDNHVRYHYGFIFTMSNYGRINQNLIPKGTGYGRLPPRHVGELIIFVLIMLLINIYKLYLCVFLIEEVMGQTSGTNQNMAMKNQIELRFSYWQHLRATDLHLAAKQLQTLRLMITRTSYDYVIFSTLVCIGVYQYKKEYMRHKQLPLTSQKKFLDYYDFRFQNKYFREEPLMEILSDHLRAEMLLYTCRNLGTNDVFKDIPKDVVGAILSRMEYEVYLPNDVIIKAGSPGDCMYFISSGKVAIYTPTGREVCHLDDGDYFGETALIMKDSKRVATVMALEMTELYCLNDKDFRELIASNAELLRRMVKLSTSRINKTILLEEAHKKSRGTTLSLIAEE